MVVVMKLITVFATVTSITAELPKIRSLKEIAPEQIGLYHTEAFERLGEKYLSINPKNLFDVEKDMIDIMSSFCLDDECGSIARRNMLEEVPFHVKNVKEVYPENLDPRLKKYLESFESTIRSIDTHDAEEVVAALSLIQDELRESPTINKDEKNLALAAGSVAIESTKLWSSVLSNPKHPLNKIKSRKLDNSVDQFFENSRNLQDVVIEINTGITQIQAVFVILVDFFTLILFLGFPFPSIMASFYSFVTADDIFSRAPPTVNPSAYPSITESPSLSPSISAKPSSSIKPTVQPSFSPSGKPSAKPSSDPSSKPSSTPSVKPSATSSFSPSAKPSTTPSSTPSSSPSLSSAPSTVPTSQPTTTPSITPTSQPTTTPSSVPSRMPS